MPEGPYRNSFLRHLDADTIKRLKLSHAMLEIKHELVPQTGPIERLHFIEEGIASMVNPFLNGTEVEVATFGYDSVTGLSGLMGPRLSPVRVFMQIRGHGFSAPMAAAKAEFENNPGFHRLALLHMEAQFAQAAQNAACNGIHKHEQRMAKWLLFCSERLDRDTLDLSHEFLAQMLGSTRSTVTLTAGALKRKGLIEHRRGSIRIRDHTRLESHACECYITAREQLRSVMEGVVGTVG